MREGLIGFEDIDELKMVRDEARWIDLFSPQNLQEHRRADGIDQSRCDRNIPVPQGLQVQVHLLFHAHLYLRWFRRAR